MKKISPKKEIKKGVEYLLRGKVVCGICGHNLDRKNKRPVYTCDYRITEEKLSCNDIRVFEDDIELAIFQMIKKQAEIILALKNSSSVLDAEIKDFDFSKVTEFEKQIKFLENKKISLYESYLREEISLADYKEEKTFCDEKLLEVRNIYEVQKSKEEQVKSVLNINSKVTNIAKDILKGNKLTPELVDVLISKVFVFPNNRIEIEWKFEDFMKIS